MRDNKVIVVTLLEFQIHLASVVIMKIPLIVFYQGGLVKQCTPKG